MTFAFFPPYTRIQLYRSIYERAFYAAKGWNCVLKIKIYSKIDIYTSVLRITYVIYEYSGGKKAFAEKDARFGEKSIRNK